ncbi:MAG: OmpA family protein [Boseongicola sp.]|nr:MAG: OmpA family protein [Boseongicola sp.]
MPRLRYFLPHTLAVLIAGAACFGVAVWTKSRIEDRSLTAIGLALGQSGHDWTDVAADGLLVTLSGVAPDEATRFAALSIAGTIVDASRVLDHMGVAASLEVAAPDFSVEILKNQDGLSLIGLIPTESNPDTVIERARQTSGAEKVTDLLEDAEFAPPPGWEQALTYGLGALKILPRSKVSVSSEKVTIIAVAEDPEDKRRIERTLKRDAPSGLEIVLNISAPRPVITPFTLRFFIAENEARFDACSADTETTARGIAAAAMRAGASTDSNCTLGLGAPSSSWGEAAVAGIDALSRIGLGTLTMSNADMTLVAAEGTEREVFDRHIGELEGALPEVFSLNAVLLEKPAEVAKDDTVPDFQATRSTEGQVEIRGRLGDELTQTAVENFAAAHFGAANIVPATRITGDLPAGWATRVLSSLEALAIVNDGTALVTPDLIEITGVSGRSEARSEITRILSSKLEDGAAFELDVSYSEALDPLAALPTPEECVEQINSAATSQKITFAPSSTDIEDAALGTIDAISELLRDCQTVKIEISGHTDSQGREIMNQQLSQARADAVLNAIMARRVLTSNLTAKGYGEAAPIADNDTEEGREANRRIEFRLVLPENEEQASSAETEDAAGEETSQ